MPSFLFVADPEISRPYRYPERDVEGAVPYKGAVEMGRNHRRGGYQPPVSVR